MDPHRLQVRSFRDGSLSYFFLEFPKYNAGEWAATDAATTVQPGKSYNLFSGMESLSDVTPAAVHEQFSKFLWE